MSGLLDPRETIVTVESLDNFGSNVRRPILAHDRSRFSLTSECSRAAARAEIESFVPTRHPIEFLGSARRGEIDKTSADRGLVID